MEITPGASAGEKILCVCVRGGPQRAVPHMYFSHVMFIDFFYIVTLNQSRAKLNEMQECELGESQRGKSTIESIQFGAAKVPFHNQMFSQGSCLLTKPSGWKAKRFLRRSRWSQSLLLDNYDDDWQTTRTFFSENFHVQKEKQVPLTGRDL